MREKDRLLLFEKGVERWRQIAYHLESGRRRKRSGEKLRNAGRRRRKREEGGCISPEE